MLLRDQVVLVTGASVGIGRSLAVGLAAEGAIVGVNFKNSREDAKETCRLIEQAGGVARLVPGDISKKEEAERVVEETVQSFGRINALINNAARTRFGPFCEVTEEDWLDVANTNLKGTFFTSVAAVRFMSQRDGGSIVNVSSCAARLMVRFHSLYAMSKGGIETLTQQLAVELAPLIRVNCIAPGPTSTARNRRYDVHYDGNWGRVIPMKRVAAPEDMVGAVAFLVSPRASFITGQVVRIDGGWTLKGHTPDLEKEDFSSDRSLG